MIDQFIQQGKVILVKGSIEKYQNQIQIKLASAETDLSAPIDLFIPGTRRPVEQLEADFEAVINKVDHAGLCELLQRCFEPEVMARFRRWPAAMRHHGAVVGGLLEHTVNVTIIAEQLSDMYPCNANLVLAGALLHDIGKLEELEEQIGIGLTPDGRMFGHIVRGMQYVQAQAKQVPELDEATCTDLLHIILAHHTKEFSSPVSPVTIEALIVHLADKAEAALTEFLEQCQRASTVDGWTPYINKFGGHLRIP